MIYQAANHRSVGAGQIRMCRDYTKISHQPLPNQIQDCYMKYNIIESCPTMVNIAENNKRNRYDLSSSHVPH